MDSGSEDQDNHVIVAHQDFHFIGEPRNTVLQIIYPTFMIYLY